MTGRGIARSSSVRGCGSVRRATVARSSSVTRPQTAASSSSTLQLNSGPRKVRSLTPPARIDDTRLSAEPNDRQASTPEKEHSSASPTHPNFLDDSNMSAIQNSYSGAVPKVKSKSRKDMMDERKKVKEDKEIKCLIAEMEAVLATAELYEEQEARKRSGDELKVEEIKSEIAEKLDAINFYTYCCKTIPSLIQAQEVVDRAKEKKEELLEIIHGSKDSAPITGDEITRIGEDLKSLKGSVERLKTSLFTKRISLPMDELISALNEASKLFIRMNNPRQMNRILKKVTKCTALMEKLVGSMDRMEELSEEKIREIVSEAAEQVTCKTPAEEVEESCLKVAVDSALSCSGTRPDVRTCMPLIIFHP
ncbi:hypothetical protein GE061_016288 [Apolygus lucorum]|uniref:Uncharacterized protein n=1 Tax=Apolygus lucorum TaxID=248454 RepID=A0A6A4K416_APOLU|nr:hypothetical protein GE061_016288 [Apolygus lucorum]